MVLQMRVPFNSLVLGLESVSMCPSVQCNEESREDVGMMQGAAQVRTSALQVSQGPGALREGSTRRMGVLAYVVARYVN